MTAQNWFPTGVEALVAGLEEFGAEPVLESRLVTYTVVPVTGPLAGLAVRTGVDEAAARPTVPPHLIRLSANVASRPRTPDRLPWTAGRRLARTTSLPGAAHGCPSMPIAHVRGVLRGAVRSGHPWR
ncbi:hypothetical protein Psi02_15310 [Planotetraspora silvatica]|uniref:Uncharacterized protein n=1 Tax=Planotetraspora silvatica TaxID=234614 RepID=A0A8J3UHM6_9ACTN|nr:hypothetical protein Psi02_15310 [Planotetraspora silvatica]